MYGCPHPEIPSQTLPGGPSCPVPHGMAPGAHPAPLPSQQLSSWCTTPSSTSCRESTSATPSQCRSRMAPRCSRCCRQQRRRNPTSFGENPGRELWGRWHPTTDPQGHPSPRQLPNGADVLGPHGGLHPRVGRQYGRQDLLAVLQRRGCSPGRWAARGGGCGGQRCPGLTPVPLPQGSALTSRRTGSTSRPSSAPTEGAEGRAAPLGPP